MRRNAILITAIIAVGFLFTISRTSDTVSLAWRTVLYKSTNIMGLYQATLRCDGPKEDLIPQAYMVYLHHGCSLEQHKRTVGEGADLDSAIRHVFLETEQYGFIYEVKLNDSALAAVRSDLVVDFVECEYEAHLSALDPGEEL
jgi:hypothetical protein